MNKLRLPAVAPGHVAASCLLATCLLVAPAHAAKPCPPSCVQAASVVHAAGVPPGLRAAAEELSFVGDQIAPAAQAALTRLADEAKALPAKAVLRLKVSADGGLRGPAASAQAKARAKALRVALTDAGVPAARLKIDAR